MVSGCRTKDTRKELLSTIKKYQISNIPVKTPKCPTLQYFNVLTGKCEDIKESDTIMLPSPKSSTIIDRKFFTIVTGLDDADNDKIVNIMNQNNYQYIVESYDKIGLYGHEFIIDKYTHYISVKNGKPTKIKDIKFPLIFYNGKCIGGYEEFKQLIEFKLHIYPKKEVTFFYGIYTNAIAGMIYLNKKHPNSCLIYPSDEDFTKRRLPIIWDEDKKILHITDNFWESFKACDKRFTIFPLRLFWKSKHTGLNSYHANYVIYDHVKKSMERFEPNNIKFLEIDDELFKTFNEMMGENFIETYHSPLNVCPNYNSYVQYVQVKEKLKIDTDPGGFCAAWSLWYADIRLSYPELEMYEVIEYAMFKLENSGISFTSFIRNYADFINEMGIQLRIDTDQYPFTKVYKDLFDE